MRLTEAASELAEGAQAANTRRAYAADWRDFSTWCSDAGVRAMPAEPATVANYLAEKAGVLSVPTLSRRLAGIRAEHKAQGRRPPAGKEVDRVLAAIKRRYGRPPRQKKALLLDDLQRAIAKLPTTPTGLRDRALLLTGFAAALRASELAPISLTGPDAGDAQLLFVEGGAEILLARSKGDQERRGVVIGLPSTGRPTCPVAALQAWLDAANIRSGPVFRSIDRWGTIGATAIGPSAASAIVKRAAAAIGLDPAVYTCHSQRRGMITEASRSGLSAAELQRLARHKSFDTTLRYIEASDRFKDSAAGKVGL